MCQQVFHSTVSGLIPNTTVQAALQAIFSNYNGITNVTVRKTFRVALFMINDSPNYYYLFLFFFYITAHARTRDIIRRKKMPIILRAEADFQYGDLEDKQKVCTGAH